VIGPRPRAGRTSACEGGIYGPGEGLETLKHGLVRGQPRVKTEKRKLSTNTALGIVPYVLFFLLFFIYCATPLPI